MLSATYTPQTRRQGAATLPGCHALAVGLMVTKSQDHSLPFTRGRRSSSWRAGPARRH